MTTDESLTEEEQRALEEGDPVSSLLKRSLTVETNGAVPTPEKPVLREVQRKIRKRSKGKFYSDGWSTSATKINYALVAIVMLFIVAIAYFALGPTSFTR